VRVIVDTRARTPHNALVIRHTSAAPTLIAHGPAGRDAAARLAGSGVETVECATEGGRVALPDLLRRLAARGIVTLLAEGGGEVHWSLLSAGVVDRVLLFVAPVIVGGREAVPVVGGAGVERMDQAFRFVDLERRWVGDDLLLAGRVAPPRVGAGGS
jgi:diaminohydroxyphosphoribosylaminopyrimidine deaminase/5-amino-6-(5-phosphoribosylamino)uracil reductase